MSKVTEKMRRIFCKKNTIVAACAVAVITVSGSIAYAATANGYDPVTAKQNGGWTSTVTGTQYNSYGKINYTNGSNSVVVDAADIAAIDNMVGEGKTQIKNAIHAVDADDRLGTSAWTETTFPDFGNLASLISGSQTLTEAQAGTQALNNNGEALYYKDQAASEARDLTQTCTDDTGYPVYYQSATAANLTAGSAAFVDGKLILGTGADNDTYMDLGKEYVLNHANIEYLYHHHSGNPDTEGGCYEYVTETTTCKGKMKIYKTRTGSAYFGDAKCSVCGRKDTFITGLNDTSDNPYYTGQTMGICGKEISSGQIMLTCGKTEETIESAHIVFK